MLHVFRALRWCILPGYFPRWRMESCLCWRILHCLVEDIHNQLIVLLMLEHNALLHQVFSITNLCVVERYLSVVHCFL